MHDQPNKRSRWIVISVAAGILLTVSIFAVVLMGKPHSAEKALQETVEIPLDPAAYENWVVYNNQQLKISIEIPPEWGIDEERDTNNQPTGIVKFFPTENAEQGPSQEVLLTVGKFKEGMSNQAEFTQLKQAAELTEVAEGYKKLGVIPVKNSEALIFQKETPNQSFELMGWLMNGNTNVFVETKNTAEEKEEAILFHRYILGTITFL